MKFLATIALARCVLGARVATDQQVHQDPLQVPGTFSDSEFPVSDQKWELAPLEEFHAEGSTLGMAGSDFVATGNPITLDIIRTKRFSLLTIKHAHYVFLQDGKAVSWMRSKFNPVSLYTTPVFPGGMDWDLLPGSASLGGSLVEGLGQNKNPKAKQLRLAKGKGVIFPYNPTYFAKVYIKGPKAKGKASDVYYTITHLNPISKGFKDFGESRVRITRGWCRNAASNKKCKTDAEVVCTFYHKTCVLKSKSGEEIGSIERVKKGIVSGGNWRIVAQKGDALLFAQVAGFLDMADDMKRTLTLGPAKIPVNIIEKVR